MNEQPVRGRFAPSPSGRLHLGNMLSSLIAWLDVRSLGGEMVFRLEDLDPDRSFYEYSCLMADDLEWFGLDWDIGWHPSKDESNCYAQSNRTAFYESFFNKLNESGLVYPCFCSRAQRLAASAPHPGEKQDFGCGCSNLSDWERVSFPRKPSYKVRVNDCIISFIDEHYGEQSFSLRQGRDDFIIRRTDGVFAYQLAVSYDDAVMGISRVVRANDLLTSTPKQIWLIEKMGYPIPTYCHSPLLVSQDGRKMSKRYGDLSMETLRETHTPQQLCGKLAYITGLIDRPDAISPYELIEYFDWKKVPKNNIILPIELFF